MAAPRPHRQRPDKADLDRAPEPVVPPGTQPSLMVRSATATLTIYSGPTGSDHVVVRRTDGEDVRETEFPWAEWGNAARYCVGVIERSVDFGEPDVVCGDCHHRTKRSADGYGHCPTHGRIG